MAGRRSFVAELKRRNVLRAAVLYACAVWALSQGVSQLTPALGLPDSTTRWFLIACVIGFPFWLVFAWLYEFTPHGFKREAELAEAAPVRHSNARRLDFAIIAVMAVAIALLASGYFVRAKAPGSVASAFDPPPDSIVVLPFANLSGDPGQAYFSNGITEELTDALGQNTSLAVTAWETASRYAGSKQSASAIGRALNVAHILGGSIQREGDAVRVSAELVSTVSGRQLWSRHYDDSFQHIFAVQDKITAAIAAALAVKFAALQRVPTRSPAAHEIYLKGLAALDHFTAADARIAQLDFEQALRIDPKYADAWAGLAGVYGVLAQVSTLPLKDALQKIRTSAQSALALDPHNVGALVALAVADEMDHRTLQSRLEFEQALALDPSSEIAHLNLGTELPLRQALAQEQEATRLDPDDATAQNNLAMDDQYLGNWSGMVTATLALNRLSPHNIDPAFYLALAYTRMHQGDAAVKALDLVQPDNALDRQLLDAGRLTYQALLQPALRPAALAALDRLRRAAISPESQGDLLQLYLALGAQAVALQMLPAECAAQPVGCDDLGVNPMYASLRGNPRFQRLSKQYTTITLGPAPATSVSH